MGFVIVGEVVTVIHTVIPNGSDEPLTIVADDTWRLQKGEKGEHQDFWGPGTSRGRGGNLVG